MLGLKLLLQATTDLLLKLQLITLVVYCVVTPSEQLIVKFWFLHLVYISDHYMLLELCGLLKKQVSVTVSDFIFVCHLQDTECFGILVLETKARLLALGIQG